MIETLVRLPGNFQCHKDLLVGHLDGRINYQVVDQIKGRPMYAICSAWGISAYVWWSRNGNCWFSEILHRDAYQTTLSGEVIEDVVINIQKYCGLKR